MWKNIMMVQVLMNLPMIPRQNKCLINRRINWGRGEQAIWAMVEEDSRKSKSLTIIKDYLIKNPIEYRGRDRSPDQKERQGKGVWVRDRSPDLKKRRLCYYPKF